ncbi:MAG: hypothetical protein K0R36_587 [Chryseobacterium sp.]|jgi:hypothetical protein|nr:hypothetical protein [Chryseobacterium sp.]
MYEGGDDAYYEALKNWINRQEQLKIENENQ